MQLGTILLSAVVILLPPVWYPAGAPANCDVASYPLEDGVRQMKKANLAGCDLTKASLLGATVTTSGFNSAVFRKTICPDGSNSDANGGTCIGHGI